METPESQEAHFFSDLLKTFRKRKKLTQQQLAQRIEASRESVSLWERGMFKPETTGMVETLVKVLGLDNDEKRLFFEAYLGTASILPLYNFPDHNPYFTGREEILTQLHRQLTAGKPIALIQTQAISGLGGIGKTQVAIEYAYRFREHYHDILWAPASSREALMTSYLILARQLRLREREEREQYKVIEAVKRWMREHKGWLLILDDIEDLGLVREFVPAPRQGRVILTTRRGETIPIAQAIAVNAMSEEEGILFLLKRAGYLALEASINAASVHDKEAARTIVQIVGVLPLALDQAGAYIAETRRSLTDYLELFKDAQTTLLDRRGTLPSDHSQSVTATFLLAFQQVEQKNEAAIDVLKVCAFLAPDSIPLSVITQGAAHLGTILQAVAVNALQLDKTLEILQAYSLVYRDGKNQTLSIHRLVQSVLLDAMLVPEQEEWGTRVISALNTIFPQLTMLMWNQGERLLPHALACTAYPLCWNQTNLDLACVLHKTAWYLLLGLVQYDKAELFFYRSLCIVEQALGPDHPDVSHPLYGLTHLYLEQGKYEQAKPLCLRALQITEHALGPDHPQVSYPLTGLANLYYAQGKYKQAEPLYQRALCLREQAVGPEHPEMAHPLVNLADLYYAQGKYEQAEPLYQRALRLIEQALGSDHTEMINSLTGLANLYYAQGKDEQAELLYQQALRILEQSQASEHPAAAELLTGLATFYYSRGKYEQVEPLYQQALRLIEQALGPDHPNAAEILDAFATFYRAQSRSGDAERMYQHALVIREQALGPLHPKTVATRTRYATLLREMGRSDDAARLEVPPFDQADTQEE